MRRTVTAWALAAIALAGAHVPASADPTAEAVVEALRSPALQDDAGHRAADLQLRVGPATLTLEDGVLYPSLSVEGRPVQFVFTGAGRLESPAPDEIEAGQLLLFTGMDHLDLPFEGAVLVAAGDAVSAALSRNGSPPAEEADAADAPAAGARELLERWQDSTEAKRAAVEGPLFLDAMGDSLLEGYFAAWLTGTPHGDVLFTVDPRREEALTVSHFVAAEIEGRELRSIRKSLGREQRRGRMRDLELEDLGNQDVWMSHAVAPPEGTTWPAREAFEPSHYALEIDLARSDPWLRGSATIDLTAVAGGRRGLSLDLMPDLTVTAVRTGDGTSLPYHQQRGDLSVALPGESREGEDLRLVVEYEGNPVDQVQHLTFALLSTRLWYPHAGEIDRATYDVAFHVPSGLDLLAPGHRVEEGEDGGGQRVRYLLDYPAQQFSFELGDFVVKEQTVGKVRVSVAYDRESSGFPGKVKKEIETTVRDALTTFQEMFGEYPLDRMTVVLTPRGFSQGFLGFVTLSHSHMGTYGGWRDLLWWLPDREAFIAHEIAHQWWGNLVGWGSYRDQWLSEGLANWSAEAYMRRQSEGGVDPEKGPFLGWTDALLDVNEEGILVESLGPVVLGGRLDSSAYPGGYIPIVYLKGGMIIDMLSRYAGQEAFEQMLGQLAAAARGHDLTTTEFVKAMERMLGRNLGWFERRWVRGTGLPTVDYTYSFRQEPQEGWTVEFEASQRAMHYSRSHFVRTPQGGWDLERHIVVPALPVEKSILAVEFQVLTEGKGEGRSRGPRLERFGNAVLRGSSSTFHITVPTQPVRAWLDRREMAPARFFCETCEPKRTGLFRGADLAIAGEWEDAEQELLGALERPVFVPAEPGEGPTKVYLQLRGRNLDGLIHLHLASLYLDQGRDADGAAEFQLAMDTMDRTGRWEVEDVLAEIPTGPGADRSMYDPAEWHKRPAQWSALDFIDQVASRLEIRRGEYDAAYERLSKSLVVAQKSTRYKTRYVPRVRERSPESLALLAIAAWETGRPEEAREALERAEEGGVDGGELAGLAAAEGTGMEEAGSGS